MRVKAIFKKNNETGGIVLLVLETSYVTVVIKTNAYTMG